MTAPNREQVQAQTKPQTPEQLQQTRRHYNTVRELLGHVSEAFCTKALPDGDLLQLPAHDEFKPASKLGEDAPFEKTAKSIKNPDDLLALEQKLMVQLERLDALERAVAEAGSAPHKLQAYLEKTSEQLDAVFEDTMKTVKNSDRDMETAAWSFHVFMEESRITTNPDMAQLVHVLNARGEDLADHPYFGKGQHFGPLQGIARVHENVYGLWVLDAKVSNRDAAARLGAKARSHTAMALLNVDAEGQIDTVFRRDGRGDTARAQQLEDDGASPEQLATKKYHRSPVSDKEMRWVGDCVGDVEGLERVVLCFSPVRVREASRFEDQLGDVFVPASYTYGGKVAFVSLVSKEDGIATVVAQARQKYSIAGYMVESSSPERRRNDNGPFLFDHEGYVDRIPKGIIAGVRMTGAESEEMMKRCLDVFVGVHTARGSGAKYQVATELSYDYLRRLLAVVARGVVGQPQSKAEKIRASIEALLQKNLMSADDDRKPFRAVSIDLDTTSPEGQQAWAEGGIRLVVRVQGRTAIPEVWIHIVPQGTPSTTSAFEDKK